MLKLTQGDKTDRTRTRVKKRRFLAALAKVPSVSKAAEAVGAHRSTVYEWRDRDPQFAKAWDEAIEASVDNLVVAAFKRALKSSDSLLQWLLKCHRPQVYNMSSGENVAADDKGPTLQIYYNNDQPLKQLLDFPLHKSMFEPPKEKSDQIAEAYPPAQEPEEISEAPHPALTGKLSQWKRNGRKFS